ncbi:MAG: subtype B tannase [Veillonella sp.]|uniref:subtype B tannase n=1 Tax=Veillonella sp. TaxID=1926307 RepID=UPI00290BDD7B|nr:subtype B tannase [Veillonella sp.]MDU5733199.1 subtype B tannase [Veillonella sp.]
MKSSKKRQVTAAFFAAAALGGVAHAAPVLNMNDLVGSKTTSESTTETINNVATPVMRPMDTQPTTPTTQPTVITPQPAVAQNVQIQQSGTVQSAPKVTPMVPRVRPVPVPDTAKALEEQYRAVSQPQYVVNKQTNTMMEPTLAMHSLINVQRKTEPVTIQKQVDGKQQMQTTQVQRTPIIVQEQSTTPLVVANTTTTKSVIAKRTLTIRDIQRAERERLAKLAEEQAAQQEAMQQQSSEQAQAVRQMAAERAAEAQRQAALLAQQQEAQRQAELLAQQQEAQRQTAIKAEQERIAAQQAEAQRQAVIKAEQDRIAAEQAEAQRQAAIKAEQERIAAEQAEVQRQAAIKAEQERIAAEQAEAQRQATIKAEQERIAAEQAEAQRQAAIKAEQDRIAAEQAEAQRQAAIRAEQERIAAEQAEAQRQAAIRAEQERIAAEQAEAQRQAAIKAEQERIAVEQAEADAEKARLEAAEAKAAAEAAAKAQAEAQRQAAIKAEQERIASEQAKAEQEAKAKAQAEVEAQRQAAIKAEQERIAAEQAKAEQEAKAKAQAEVEAQRQAAIKAEQERIAAEQAKAAQEAKIKAEQEAKAKAEAETKAQAEAKARAEAEAKQAQEPKLPESYVNERNQASTKGSTTTGEKNILSQPIDPPLQADTSAKITLTFDINNYESMTGTVDNKEIKYRAFEYIPYVSNPIDIDQQYINIYIPEEYFNNGTVNGYNTQTAPIFMPNNVGGYMPSQPMAPKVENNKPNSALYALSRGYVVASPATRGRTNKASDGNFIGKAPAVIVDLQAATAYLHANDATMPGNAKRIITNGTSAGGAVSLLQGATGNTSDYQPYLQALGAATASTDVYASSAYAPITNLDAADMAYEWSYNGITSFNKVTMGQGELPQANVGGAPAPMQRSVQRVNLTNDDVAYSDLLKSHFPDYVNNLQLRDRTGVILKLDKKGNGTFKQYVKSFIIDAANKAKSNGTDLSRYSFLILDKNTGLVKDIDWDAYNSFTSRSKVPGAFDSRFNDSGENSLFGTSTSDTNHFTITAALHDTTTNNDVYVENAKIVTMMNPMNYLGSPSATNAKYYRIRYGTADSNTSVAIPLIVGTRAQNLGYSVDMATPFGVDHAGDYDLQDLFNWMDSIVKNGR